MTEAKATIVISARDQAGATLNKIFLDVQAQTAKTTDSTKKLSDSQKDASEKTKDHGMRIVDIAAKLYLLQVALRGVADSAVAAFEFGKLGAEVSQTKISFDNMTESVGVTAALLDRMKVASHGTVSELQLMQAAQTALIGLGEENGKVMADSIPRILEIARAASIANPALGDTAFLFESLTTGLKRMSPRLIDNTGLQLKLGAANEAYAAILGKTVEEMSAEEKQIALLNATLEAGDRLIEQIGGTTESATDKFNKLSASSENLKNSLAENLSPSIGMVVEVTDRAVVAAELLVSWQDKIISAVQENSTATLESTDQYYQYADSLRKVAENSGLVVTADGDLIAFKRDLFGITRAEITENYILSRSEFDVAKSIEDQTDSRRESIDEMRNEITTTGEMIEANQKWLEKRTDAMNSLFFREIQINQRREESQRKITDKIEDLESDLADKLRDIWEDAERDRTRVTADAAEDRANIESDYANRIADANKDLSELYDELAGKNPYLSQDTQTGLSNAEASVEGLEKRLADLQRRKRENPDDESIDAEIDNVRNQLDMANELWADAKKKAREEERRNRIEAQIREKQELIAHLEAERIEELARVTQKEQEKLAIISLSQEALTAKTREESLNRRLELEAEFRAIAEAANRDIKIATTDAFLGLVDANSKVGQSLFELQAKNYGATDAMIKDFILVRESINSPTGLIGALNSVAGNNSFLRMISQVSSLNGQLSITNALVSGLGGGVGIGSGGSAGRRASGGGVQAGHSYLVGEEGPELLNVGQSGNITPNNAIGGGGNVTIQISAGVFQGSQSDAIKFANWVGPLVASWQTKYGGAPNSQGTRRIKSS